MNAKKEEKQMSVTALIEAHKAALNVHLAAIAIEAEAKGEEEEKKATAAVLAAIKRMQEIEGQVYEAEARSLSDLQAKAQFALWVNVCHYSDKPFNPDEGYLEEWSYYGLLRDIERFNRDGGLS